MDVKRAMIFDGITLMSLAHKMPGKMNPGWSGLEQGFLLTRLPTEAAKLRIAPENVSRGSPKPRLER